MPGRLSIDTGKVPQSLQQFDLLPGIFTCVFPEGLSSLAVPLYPKRSDTQQTRTGVQRQDALLLPLTIIRK